MEIVFSSHSKMPFSTVFLLAMMMMMMIDDLFFSQLLFSPYLLRHCTVCYRVNKLAMIELIASMHMQYGIFHALDSFLFAKTD